MRVRVEYVHIEERNEKDGEEDDDEEEHLVQISPFANTRNDLYSFNSSRVRCLCTKN